MILRQGSLITSVLEYGTMRLANPPQLRQQDSTAAAAALVSLSGTSRAARTGRRRTVARRVPYSRSLGAKSQELSRSLRDSIVATETGCYRPRSQPG